MCDNIQRTTVTTGFMFQDSFLFRMNMGSLWSNTNRAKKTRNTKQPQRKREPYTKCDNTPGAATPIKHTHQGGTPAL